MASLILFADLVHNIFGVLMFLTALFLILLVLIQRGRGGGLAGALGGMGGQSAFGSKAGDTFTRITIGAASFWICLCILGVWLLGRPTAGPFADRPDKDASAATTDESSSNQVDGEGAEQSAPSEANSALPAGADDKTGAAAEVTEESSLDLGPAPSESESPQSSPE
jgi:preprotein translocase subunit SecG